MSFCYCGIELKKYELFICPSCNNKSYDTKYMVFRKDMDSKTKTEIWYIYNKSDPEYEYILGVIKWYGNWRQYTFQPEFDSIFNSSCLNDIQQFLIKLNVEHKRKKVII